MSDLIERLRGPALWPEQTELGNEAADRIEELEAEVACDEQRVADLMTGIAESDKHIEELEAENYTLQADLLLKGNQVERLEAIEKAARDVNKEIGELAFEDWPELHLKNNRLKDALEDGDE